MKRMVNPQNTIWDILSVETGGLDQLLVLKRLFRLQNGTTVFSNPDKVYDIMTSDCFSLCNYHSYTQTLLYIHTKEQVRKVHIRSAHYVYLKELVYRADSFANDTPLINVCSRLKPQQHRSPKSEM